MTMRPTWFLKLLLECTIFVRAVVLLLLSFRTAGANSGPPQLMDKLSSKSTTE